MKDNKVFCWQKFEQVPIIGILRNLPLPTVLSVARAYQQAGFYALEVTMNTEGARGMIDVLGKEFPGLSIGAGTVCTLSELEMAMAAGAQFIVTPILEEAVVRRCVADGISVFPGAYTPTEIYRAWSWGATAVKVFPATQLGPQYIKDILAPLNQIKLLPTGGVTLENISSFFTAGAVGVGMGSSLLNEKLIRQGDFAELQQHFLNISTQIAEFTS